MEKYKARYYEKHGLAKNGIYFIPGVGVITREWETKTPNGNKMNGRWVFRDSCKCMLDFDTYINDLAERNEIDLYCNDY